MSRVKAVRVGRYRFALDRTWESLLARDLPAGHTAAASAELWDVNHQTTLQFRPERWSSPVNAVRLVSSAPLRALRYGGPMMPLALDIKARVVETLHLPPGAALDLGTRTRWSGQLAVLPLFGPDWTTELPQVTPVLDDGVLGNEGEPTRRS